MFARLTRLGGPPERMDEGLRHLRERIIPRVQQQDGYNGFIALGDSETGEVIGISLWESERALQATEEEANRLRAETAEASGAAMAGVESYEVPLLELRLASGERDRGLMDRLTGG